MKLQRRIAHVQQFFSNFAGLTTQCPRLLHSGTLSTGSGSGWGGTFPPGNSPSQQMLLVDAKEALKQMHSVC